MVVFKPRARLLLELGDQLIRNENIAISELTKNSYDADASRVKIELENIDSKEKSQITIEDDGYGMNLDVIKKAWLEPGTDFKERLRKRRLYSPKFKRLPLGQKGIGRFAVHKLGKEIEIITKKEGFKECVIKIDWANFENRKYLKDVDIEVIEREPEYFLNNKTGTRIVINRLWKEWDKLLVKEIYRSVNLICSPAETNNSFKIDFSIKDEDKKDWLKGIIGYKNVLSFSLFKAKCSFEDKEVKVMYEFTPENKLEKLKNRKKEIKISFGNLKKEGLDIDKAKFSSFKMEFFMYDFTPMILSEYVQDVKGLKNFLRENGGIKVYRNGIRVYDYGEPKTDWLGLDLMRVQRVGKNISNNLVIGNIYLDDDKTSVLKEKTNREGFIEDTQFKIFREIIIETIENINTEREIDKTTLKEYYEKEKTVFREPVLDDIDELRESINKKIDKKDLKEQLIQYVDNIERDFKEIRDNLLIASSAGMNFSIAIHEIQKIIQELKEKIGTATQNEKVKDLVQHLYSLLRSYTRLISRKGFSDNKLNDLVNEALFGVEFRLKLHNIKLEKDFQKEFHCMTIERMIVSSIMNLIDNSIWWIENKNPAVKRIYIGIKLVEDKPAIIIGDNGSGFQDNLEYLTKPFISRKKYGMGLGLHIVNEIMKQHKGKLKILSKEQAGINSNIDGGIIAMIFNEK
jgi:anti-sigma regulatory factor (Ser/Thr protein kinase)